jgi:hypothetical protein
VQLVRLKRRDGGEVQGAASHYRLFPRAVAELIGSVGVRELHVTLTRGRWRADRWGAPIDGAPTGAEVQAWLAPDATYVRMTGCGR